MPTAIPPPPNTSKLPRHRYELLDCVYSASNETRALILRDDLGLIRLHYERWDLTEWENSGDGFWNPVDKGATIVDSLETAKQLAQQRLRELAATSIARGRAET